MDKGYIDYERLYRINQEKAFFMVRAKSNLDVIIAIAEGVKNFV